eukprot:1391627-Amorphochlora_amoeboformis.AAC.1
MAGLQGLKLVHQTGALDLQSWKTTISGRLRKNTRPISGHSYGQVKTVNRVRDTNTDTDTDTDTDTTRTRTRSCARKSLNLTLESVARHFWFRFRFWVSVLVSVGVSRCGVWCVRVTRVCV